MEWKRSFVHSGYTLFIRGDKRTVTPGRSRRRSSRVHSGGSLCRKSKGL